MRPWTCLAAVLLAPAALAETAVDLELVLAVDISGSIDPFESAQQRRGYVTALADPMVLQAIRSNFHGRIAVTYVEWGGADQQRTLIEWRLIEDEASALAFAGALAEAPFSRAMYTSISHALDFAVPLFDDNGFAGNRKVIDISGDGPNNRGRSLTEARADALARGIVINGLPILNDRPQPWNLPTPMEMELDRYYEEEVIGGPGSFIVVAEGFEAFRDAILSKLILEIAGPGAPRTALAYRSDEN